MYADKPLFWHQGLFLQPQHFQLADLHQLYRFRTVQEFGQPYFWGLTRLVIREGALERRIFEISDIEVLFDDGNIVSFPGNATLTPRSFDKAWVDGEKPFMVYLGLRRWNAEGGNVTLTADADLVVNTMFCASPNPEETPDFLGSGPAALVKPMRYALRLFWENELENLGAYSLVPLARLERNGEQVRLDPCFVPPCLTMTASESLSVLFKDISDQVASRCRRLESYKNPGGLGGADLDFTSTVFLLALRTLNRYAPVLKHMADAPHIHPWQAFGVLRQTIGELSSFARDISALGEDQQGQKLLPDYAHENLGPCFEAARNIITRILNSLTAGPEFMTQLLYQEPFYTAELPDRAFGPNNSFWLLVKTHDLNQALPEVLRVAKLSATQGMSALLARAVHGIGLVYQETPPPGLPRSKDTLCFRIDTQSSLWLDVERTRSIALYWDSAPKEMTAYIAAIRG